MKALKLAMVAILITSTMACLAGIDGIKPKPKKAYTISLLKARHIPGLVAAMHAQIDPSFLYNDPPVYTAEVTYNGAVYRITGTRAQWVAFFFPKHLVAKEVKPVFGTR